MVKKRHVQDLQKQQQQRATGQVFIGEGDLHVFQGSRVRGGAGSDSKVLAMSTAPRL